MIWIVSDEHYYHANIIRYCRRPFDNVKQMNSALIDNHNNTVGQEDVVYHLGDFGRASSEAMKAVLSQLNGTHIIIRGNHDRGVESLYGIGFVAVLESAIIKYDGLRILLNHRPLDFLPEGADVVFHGHVHRADPADLIEADETPFLQPFNLNLCVDVINYRPISIKEGVARVRIKIKDLV